jgi:3-phosphoshikimate 1-carboxyvinyltransferase
LQTAGVTAYEKDGKMFIVGSKIKGGIFDGANDHRIVMSSAVISSVADGESQILGAHAVEKSYPEFFKDYNLLGGKADVCI